MTNSMTDSTATMEFRPPFWRELLNSTLSYLAWGYGALLLSFISYGAYVSYKWMARSPHTFALALTALLTLRVVIAAYREIREVSGARARAYAATEWITLLIVLRVLALVFLSWKPTGTPTEKASQHNA